MNRIKTIQNGERPPDDILTHILKLACKHNIVRYTKKFSMKDDLKVCTHDTKRTTSL